MIKNLRNKKQGCYLGDMFCGCLLFADDILLLSASVLQLQSMLNIYYAYCCEWDLQFNAKKCTVMCIGKDNDSVTSVIELGIDQLTWVKKIKYLGVYIQSRGCLRLNADVNCRKFLGAFFSILQHCGHLSETVLCEIIVTKCLPVLTYGLECFRLLSYQKQKVNVAFNTIIRRIFKLSRYTSVRDIIMCIGCKPTSDLLDERRILLLLSCLHSEFCVVSRCAHSLRYTVDFVRICNVYGVDVYGVDPVLGFKVVKKLF
jgi:hypothetical protein